MPDLLFLVNGLESFINVFLIATVFGQAIIMAYKATKNRTLLIKKHGLFFLIAELISAVLVLFGLCLVPFLGRVGYQISCIGIYSLVFFILIFGQVLTWPIILKFSAKKN